MRDLAVSSGKVDAPESLSEVPLVSRLAHELNNALMAAQANLDTIRLVWSKLSAAAGLAQSEVMRLHPAARWASEMPGLLEDMDASLAFISGIISRARASAQPPHNKLGRINVGEVIASSLRQSRVVLDSGIRVVRLPASGVFYARGDAEVLQQVFVNLFLNAARAMRNVKHSRVLTIRVSRKTDCGVAVAISDTGVGVRAADRRRLFQPFFTTCREQGGTGLGLYVSREIMRRQNGDLTLDARVKSGATFIVTMPR